MARYEKGRKEETHLKIVKAASERFRKDGIDGVGVVALMGEVGLTQGGFYAHFASKEALVKEAALYAFGARADKPGKGEGAPFSLRAFIENYLTASHRDRPAQGCPYAALGPELARRPKATRLAIGKQVRVSLERLAAGLASTVPEEVRPAKAATILAQLSGTLQLARLAASKAESDAILAAGREAAFILAGLDAMTGDASRPAAKA